MSDSQGPFKGKGETVDVVDDRVDQSDSEPSEEDSDEPKHRDKQWLHHQYHVLSKTTTEIGDECGVHGSTISRWMDKLGIETRDKSEAVSVAWNKGAPWRNEEWLHDQYEVRGKSAKKIADGNNTSAATIQKWLNKFDIEMRDPREMSPAENQDKKYKERGWLESQYVDREKYATEIADMCGVSTPTIFYWLDKYEIPTRSIEETQKLRSERQNGLPKSLEEGEVSDKKDNSKITVGNASYNGPSSGLDMSWNDLKDRKTTGNEVPYHDEWWLREAYISKGMSTYEIADHCDCSQGTIMHWMDKHNIKTRAPGGTKATESDD